MRFHMNTIISSVRFRRCAASLALLALLCTSLWAGSKKDIESVTAEGGEVWQNNFSITERKKGTYNYIVYARDRAGNETIDGPYNIKIDPSAGLPEVRVVYPQNNDILRDNIDILGIASGGFGVARVMVRLNDGDWGEATGTEYWNRRISFGELEDGRHSLYVRAFDDRNASGSVQRINFTLDTSPPSIELTSHKVGDLLAGTVTIRGTASDPNGIGRLEYSSDGVTYRTMSGRKSGGGVDFSISLATKQQADGPLVFYVRAVDTTGIATTLPYLFFVDNKGPELELYSPSPGENVFDSFFLSGRVYDTIGIESFYYEWGRVRESIELRPGDPFWSVPLKMEKGSPTSIKITAIDKVGNASSISAKLEDRRRVKVPVLIIDFPQGSGTNALAPDASIYGRIDIGVDPQSVEIEGIGSVDARHGFRIPPEMIPQGRGTLKLTPVAADGARGSSVNFRFDKTATATQSMSLVAITSPEKFSWQSGANFFLSGVVNPGTRLEFRLSPTDVWHTMDVEPTGAFASAVSMVEVPHGPIHLELRTTIAGVVYRPLYHPFNRGIGLPDIQFFSPVKDGGMINGIKTVLGSVESAIPIASIAYSLDRMNYQEIPFVSHYGKVWFSYLCDFNALYTERGQLFFRITDAANSLFEGIPEYVLNPSPPLPTIIVNTPTENMVVTSPFAISGVAFDEIGISGVYWRILGPSFDSISKGPAGDEARHIAELFMEEPDVPFNRLFTDQSFQIPIDFATIIDGEYIIEVYAANTDGVRSETVSRPIHVSTARPETVILSPSITRYNNHAILIQGNSIDANGIGSTIISMDNGSTWQDVVLFEDDSWELSLNTVAYADGVYSALIQTTDRYGLTTFSNAMVNIDNVPPELYIMSPLSGQNVGTTFQVNGRVSDNIRLKSLDFHVISADNPAFQLNISVPLDLVIFETISLEGFPQQGEYIFRAIATDLADNVTIVSRNIIYDADDSNAEVAIFNPLPGETYTGPIHVVGTVSGTSLPDAVEITMDGMMLILAPVNRYGVFRYEIAESMLKPDSPHRILVTYRGEKGNTISSQVHTVYYSPLGPSLVIDSHRDCDAITKRPWLSGRAWVAATMPENGRRPSREQRADMSVKQVDVSYDNGRTFRKAKGGNEWKFRLETSLLPVGPQPVMVRATFGNGETAVRRILLYVDTTAPQVATVAPLEKTVHRDNILVYGTASDNITLADVDISLRPYSKFWYSVPGPLRGLYLDAKAMGATYFDVGLGLSLFDDNVRLQAQFGITPADGVNTMFYSGGRYTGYAIGIKLLANIFHLPFDYLFGPDWAFYSMNVALGANFSWFTMHEWEGSAKRSSLFMSAVVGQWDIANIDMQFFYPKWKYFHRFAVYVGPELWFASSDVQAETIFRLTVGLRLNFF